MDRRTFLKGASLAGAALVGGDLWPNTRDAAEAEAAASGGMQPNVLVIMVDQLRYPQWFPNQKTLDALLPNLARLRKGAVSFGQYFTAANACTPARASLLTGLYTHQTGCLLTAIKVDPGTAVSPTPTSSSHPAAQALSLDPRFPTWGTMLRRFGYQTNWFGKWHLSNTCDLEQYGFSGGTCPSPNGWPGQGLAVDPHITDQFTTWLAERGRSAPWCTTVSFVNPHDISWYYRYSKSISQERVPPQFFKTLPPNFETPFDLYRGSKPGLQLAFQKSAADGFGMLPFRGSNYEFGWLRMLDLYLLLQQMVDKQIGRVLDALEANPAVARRTVIFFTADHGEYAGSHGLRGKGGAVYDEAIRVPLYIKDLTGQFVQNPGPERQQLVSSVDIAPYLLTLASGGPGWRTQPEYAHLANRLRLGAIVHNPAAPGRPYVLHTADENYVEGGSKAPYSQSVPSHVIGYRTATAKLGLYSFWNNGSLDIQTDGQETECYDYHTKDGRLELTNTVPTDAALANRLYHSLMHDAIPNELRAPLPSYLQVAQQSGINAYLSVQAALGQ